MPTGIVNKRLAGIIVTGNTGAFRLITLVIGKRDLDDVNKETDSSYLDNFSRIGKLWYEYLSMKD